MPDALDRSLPKGAMSCGYARKECGLVSHRRRVISHYLVLSLLLAACPAGAAQLFVDGACPASGTGASLTCGAGGPLRTINEGVQAMAALAGTQPLTLQVRGP